MFSLGKLGDRPEFALGTWPTERPFGKSPEMKDRSLHANPKGHIVGIGDPFAMSCPKRPKTEESSHVKPMRPTNQTVETV